MRKFLTFAVVALLVAGAVSAQTSKVYFKPGGTTLVVASGGYLTLEEGSTFTNAESSVFTLGADEYFKIDASSTAQTQTAGAFDLNFASITADTSAMNIAVTQNNGATATENVYGAIFTLTGNDANGYVNGILINAAATTNAAAGTYQYGLKFDCAENTTLACPDGIIITSTGIDAGVTDAIDVSASNITNAINIGSNLILGGNSDSANVGATNNTFTLTVDGTNTAVFTGADAASPADTTYDTTGAGAIVVGSADVTSITLTTDGTGTGEVVLPNGSVATAEIADDTITFANISDSSAIDADTTFTAADGIELTITPSYTSGDSEAVTINLSQADDGAATDDAVALAISLASESGDGGDTITGISITGAEGTANTVFDAAIAINNAETTTATMTDGIIITSSGANGGVVDGLDVSAANITNAVNIGVNPIMGGNSDYFNIGASDAVFLLSRNDSGAVTLTSADDDATAALTVDPGGNATLTLGASGDTVTAAVALQNAADVGACVASKCTAVEWGDGTVHKTVITFTLTGDNDLDLGDGDHGTGVKVYDFPEGRVHIIGATMNADLATTGLNAHANDTYSVALGSVVGADDNSLSSTEQDIITVITADGQTSATAHGYLSQTHVIEFDGTTTPLDLYFNVACADTSNSGASTYAVTGTATIVWTNLGDY